MSSGRSGIVHPDGLGRHECTGDARVAQPTVPKKKRNTSLEAFLKTKQDLDPIEQKKARELRRAKRKAERAEAHLKRVHAGIACRLQKVVNAAPKPKEVMASEKKVRTPREEDIAQNRRRRQWVRWALNYLLRGRIPPRIPKWWEKDDIRRASVEAAFS